MIIKNIQDKIKINKTVSILTILASVIISISALILSWKIVNETSKTIYVLDGTVPLLANRTDLTQNRDVERKAQVNLFHTDFFTLTPDNDFIEAQIKKSLYLIDESGHNEVMNLKERGFYNQIISSNSVVTIITDSILLNKEGTQFEFFGKQFINRRTSQIQRSLHTSGNLISIPRSINNAHGILIENWKILDNKTIKETSKY